MVLVFFLLKTGLSLQILSLISSKVYGADKHRTFQLQGRVTEHPLATSRSTRSLNCQLPASN